MEGLIFDLIKQFMKEHRGIKPLEFSIQENHKLNEKFFRVVTPKMLFVWYFERKPEDEEIVKCKKYWCPTHQQYKFGNSGEVTSAVLEMMKLGQTRPEISLHTGINVNRINKIYKDIVMGILTEKESPYLDDY